MAKNLFSIIIVILFGIIAGFSLLHEGLIPTHDGEYHVVRFFLFNEAFNDGNLYPRWTNALNNGFGVPLFTFVYPLPNYIAVFLHSLGISLIDSFRFEMFVAILVGAVFFYLWAKEFWGRLGGVVSSVFYAFSPYHFVDIYIRGSIGEVWALSFFPAFLWAVTKFIKKRQRKFFIYASLFLALIIFSHNILALMFFPFAVSYTILLICRAKNKKYLMFSSFCLILLGLGLSSIFWMPAILETQYVVGLKIFDAVKHFPDLYQLLIPSWGSGFSGTNLDNQMSFQIGIANLLAVLVSLVVMVKLIFKKKKEELLLLVFFFISFLFVFFLMLSISLPVWKFFSFFNYFQFPWRFLSLEILIASFLAGSIFSLVGKRHKWISIIFALILIFSAFGLGIGYTKPAYYHYRDDNYYISRSNFIDGTNSPGNVFNTIFLKSIPAKEKQRATFLKGNGKIILIEEKSSSYNFEINSRTDSEILMNLAYYPGWEIYVNNKKENVNPTKNGRFTFFLSPGENNVRVIFNDTIIRKLSAFISFVSLLLIIFLFTKRKFVKM